MTLLKSGDFPRSTVTAFSFGAYAARHHVAAASSAAASLGDERNEDEGAAKGSARYLIDGSTLESQPLLDRIAELEKALIAATSGQEEACEEAFEAGRRQGLNTADERIAESLDLLRDGIENARADFAAGLERQFDVAIALSRSVIQQVLGDDAQIGDHVIATAKRWIAELSSDRVVRLRVSAEDFPDPARLSDLHQLIGAHAVERDPAVDRGACLFDLQLGALDASIPLQLRNALKQLDGTGAKVA